MGQTGMNHSGPMVSFTCRTLCAKRISNLYQLYLCSHGNGQPSLGQGSTFTMLDQFKQRCYWLQLMHTLSNSATSAITFQKLRSMFAT